MDTRRVVLVGLGRMGRNHARVIASVPGLELVAVVDRDAPAPPDLACPFVRAIDDVEGDFDAAVVATPTPSHAEVAGRLLAAKKHVLVEKPIASTYAQARGLIEAAQAASVHLAVGHVERFNPAVRRLREVVTEGWIGTPIHFSFTRVGGYPEAAIRGTDNVLLDLAVHDIDVLRSLAGVLSLESSMCHSTWRPGVLDTAEIFLRAASGPSASVHVNWITPTKIRTIRVTGTRGVCFVDYIMQTCELYGGNLLKRFEPSETSFDVIQELYRTTDRIQFGVRTEEPLVAQARQFHRLLTEGDAGDLCLGRDALAAVLLTERAIRAERDRPTPSPPSASGLPREDDEWV